MAMSNRELLETLNLTGMQAGTLFAMPVLDMQSRYRKMSKKVHPDKNPNDPNAAVKFRRLKQAAERFMGMNIAQKAELIEELDALNTEKERKEQQEKIQKDVPLFPSVAVVQAEMKSAMRSRAYPRSGEC